MNEDANAGKIYYDDFVFTAIGGDCSYTIQAPIISPCSVQFASLGNLVFCDLNNDGLFDADGLDNIPGNADDETGIDGVLVELLDGSGNPIDSDPLTAGVQPTTVVTSGGGFYLFDNLYPGSYQVVITTPPPVCSISSVPTDTADNQQDNDDNGTQTVIGGPTVSPVITLSTSENDLTIDFGFIIPSAICGTVMEDTDNDDLGEVNMQGVTLTLKDGSGNDIDSDPLTPGVQPTTTQTLSDGSYCFNNLLPGSYIVVETQPTGYLTVTDLDSTTDDTGSPVDPTNSSTTDNQIPVNVGPGETDTGNDFIEELPASLGNLVFCDLNNDGLFDADGLDNIPGNADDETGIDGVLVELLDGSGNPIDSDPLTAGVQPTTVVTSGGGFYLFDNLEMGSYQVVINTPPTTCSISSGPTDTADNQEDNDDNGTQTTIGGPTTSPVITLSYAENDLTIDFGFIIPSAICGVVMEDNDNDDLGEVPMENVTLTLKDDLGNDIDSDPLTAGVQPTTTQTLADGSYCFTNLPPGSYIVVETQPTGYLTVTDLDSTTDDAGSPVDPSNTSTTDNQIPVNVGPGETDTGNDFIEELPASLGNLVWCDLNNDGLFDADGLDNIPGNADDETGIDGVLVELLDGSGNPIDSDPLTAGVQPTTVVTSGGGFYLFDNLEMGSYQVVINTPPTTCSISSGPTDTADNQEDNDDNGTQTTIGGPTTSPVITLSYAENDLTIDFGFVPPASLGNLVWCDENNNGLVDPNGLDGLPGTADDEVGIDGVLVELLDGSGNSIDSDPLTAGVQPTTQTTSGGGFYLFDNLLPGDYQVRIPNPPVTHRVSSVPTDTADNQQDNDDNGTQPFPNGPTTSPVINLTSGENDLTIDFGFIRGYYPTWPEFTTDCLPVGQDGNADNPDGDMFTNVVEYAFYADPCAGQGCVTDLMESAPGEFDISFTRIIGGPTDLDYSLYYSSDLTTAPTSWTEITLADLDTAGKVTYTPTGDGISETVTITDVQTLTSSTSGFFRVAVNFDCNTDGTVDVIDYAETLGYQCTPVEMNECETIADPFLDCPAFSGTIDGVSGLDIDLSTTSGTGIDFSSILSSGSYHIEITSGTLAGHRFEIASGSLETLTVENDTDLCTGDPHGSYDTSSGLPAALVGAGFVIVPDQTLADLVDPNSLNGTNSSTTADRLLFPDGAGGWNQYWVYHDTLTGENWWALSGDGITNHNTDTVSEMQGMFLHPKAEAETVCTSGMVRSWDFAAPLCDGATLLTNGYPMDMSPEQMGFDATFATGTRSPRTSDQILTWNRDGVSATDADGYCGYWFMNHDGMTDWLKIGETTLTSYDTSTVLQGDRSFFYDSFGDHLDHVVTQPWTEPTRFDNGTCP